MKQNGLAKGGTLLLVAAVAVSTYAPRVSFGQTRHKSIHASGPSAKLVREGQIIFKQQCQTCHNVGTAGGCLGPVLAGESARRTKEFIESRISSDPSHIQQFERAYGHAELLPHPRVPFDSAKKLTAYILSLPAPKGEIKVGPHAKTINIGNPIVVDSGKQSLLRGKHLVYEKGCLSCHSFGGMGGGLAPAFDGIGSRRTPAEIASQISRAQLLVGPDDEYNERGIVMPPSELSEKETSDIISFLSALK